MVALTGPRNTPHALGRVRQVPVGANVNIFQGALVQINAAGFAVPGTATAANTAIGRADAAANNTGGANGALTLDVSRGTFRFANSAAGDLITRADIGKSCFVVDDQTVAKTNNAGARPIAGIVYDVDAQGVWVTF